MAFWCLTLRLEMKSAKVGLIKAVIKKDNSVLVAYLFGSQIKDKANKYSDIDIAVLFDNKVDKKNYTDKQIALASGLSEALNKEIDIIILNQASLFLKYHILKEGMKIYEKPGRNEHNFEALAIIQYFDFLPIKSRIENGILSKIKEA